MEVDEKIKYVGPIWPAAETTSTTDGSSTSSDTATTQSTSTTQSTDTATTQSTSSDTATTQDASTSTSSDTATTQGTSWVSLGSKTYNVSVELPTCGISVTGVSYTLTKNGSATTATTFLTTDDIGAEMSFTVAPDGSGCEGQGQVMLKVTVDNGTPKSNTKSYDLTSSKSDSISVDIGKLSAGSHTIVVEGMYANSSAT